MKASSKPESYTRQIVGQSKKLIKREVDHLTGTCSTLKGKIYY